MRTLIRFGYFVLLFMPVLAGIGFSQIQGKLSPQKKSFLILGVLLFVFFEFYPGTYSSSLTEPKPRAVDLWLANQPGQGAVVQMPFDESSNQGQVYYTLFYQKPFLGGDFNANQPPQFVDTQPILDNFPDETSVKLLKKLKVEYIVVDQKAYPDYDLSKQEMNSLGLILFTTQGDQDVYTFSTP
jgi:hypothetical protein